MQMPRSKLGVNILTGFEDSAMVAPFGLKYGILYQNFSTTWISNKMAITEGHELSFWPLKL